MTGRDRGAQLSRRSVATVARYSLAVWLAAIVGAFAVGASAAIGLAVGGGITLASLALHSGLASLWVHDRQGWSRRGYLWFLWLAKWPLVGAGLWYCLARGYASPAWVCAGAAVVPVVATVFALVDTLRAAGIGRERSANAGA